MECWFEQQQQGKTVQSSMSTFSERQAPLIAHVLGGFTTGPGSCLHIDQLFCPYDLPLIHQEQQQFDTNSRRPVSNSAPICAYDVTDAMWPQCELTKLSGFKPLPCQIDAMPTRTVFSGMNEDEFFSPLSLPAWQTEPGLSELCCSEPPAKRPRNDSFYMLEDLMKKLPHGAPSLGLRTASRMNIKPLDIPSSPISVPPSPQFSSYMTLSSPPPFSVGVSCWPTLSPEVDKQHLLPILQNYRNPPYASVEPQSVAARQRRTKIREKICSLEKSIPLGSKLDTARMLEESVKYVKFLQAQVQVLECMPHANAKADLKSNPNSPKDSMNLCASTNCSSGGGWSTSVTNALPLQRSDSGLKFSMKKLSAQQMLHTLLTSSTIQQKLFSAGKVIGTVQQKELFAAAQPTLSSNFLDFHSD